MLSSRVPAPKSLPAGGSNGNCNLNGLPEESSMTVKPLDFDYLTANKEALIGRWNDLVASFN